MNTISQRFIILISLLIFAVTSISFRWPVDNGKLTSTFGESRGDHFHDGIDMVCSDNKIYPVDSGKLLYFWDKSIFPMDNYPGGGNYRIIKHKNDAYSIYMHLSDGNPVKEICSENDVIGMIGNTGHSYSKHIHFTILDIAKRSSINPFQLLPPLTDNKKPDIYDIYLRIDDKYIMIREGAEIRLTRHYPLLIKIVDTIKGRENLGIYKMEASFNNKETVKIIFKEILYSTGGLTVSKKIFQSLYDDKGYYKIEGITYIEGQNILNVVTYDYAGNKSEKTYTFNVKLDMD